MAYSSRSSTRRGSDSIWPGFVDALATLLLVIIFLLVVFVIAQMLLSQAISGKDDALDRLSDQVAELSDLLSLEREANAELRLNIAQLSSSLQEAVSRRDELIVALEEMTARAESAERSSGATREDYVAGLKELESIRRDIEALRQVRADLEAEVGQLAAALRQRERDQEDLERRLALSQGELEASERELEAARSARRDALASLESNRQQLQAAQEALETVGRAFSESKDELEENREALRESRQQLTLNQQGLIESRRTIGALRDRSKALENRLADERERTLLAQREIEDRETILRRQRVEIEEASLTVSTQTEQITLLRAQLESLREELARLSAILDASAEKDKAQEARILDLGRKLNRALAQEAQRLAKEARKLERYRSEFFGRLREVLGDRKDIRIVGDRFVFQSEVLFESGQALLEPSGQIQMAQLAETLLEISREIPADIPWVLRVDGHTDSQPINTLQFPSNWELSTARAISVVKFLQTHGVPAHRLAATGFAEYQPLDARFDEVALRRNRRIELKLTER